VIADTPQAPAPQSGSPRPAAPPEVEPAPIQLPLDQLTAELKIDSLYAGEIEIRQWATKVVVDHGKIAVAPFALQLNEAPISASANVDLTRPGYAYDLALDASQVPLAPLVNSTAPEYKNRIRGNVLAKLQLAGAGITGASLQKHLRGEASLSSTNLHFEIVTPRLKRVLTALATAFRLEDLAKSPLTLLSAQAKVADGRVQVQPLVAASEAFFARVEGAVELAPVLTNSSLNLPVQLALRDDLARQIRLANLQPASPTNYLALPPLVRIAGTVGTPETEIDKLRLAALLAGSVGSAVGGQTGTALQGVGGLLQGDTKGALGALGNLLQGQKPGSTTNPPPPTVVTNTGRSAATNLPPPPPTTNSPPKASVPGSPGSSRKP
jgi:hypothetical protein